MPCSTVSKIIIYLTIDMGMGIDGSIFDDVMITTTNIDNVDFTIDSWCHFHDEIARWYSIL